MEYSRVIMMGDPSCFAIKKGANPHTRNRWGFKKRVDRGKAVEQWHRMVETLEHYGARVHIIPAHRKLPGLVFPANAGVMINVEENLPLTKRKYLLAHLGPARAAEKTVYQDFLTKLGVTACEVKHQFEGEADLIPWGDNYILTYGRLHRPYVTPSWSMPPWKLHYGFRTDLDVITELYDYFDEERILCLELIDERFYHGDTVLATFGPHRGHLLVHAGGLGIESREQLEKRGDVIWIDEADASLFAANSFHMIHKGGSVLFMPQGVSPALRRKIESYQVETVTIDCSEFFEKGGGSIKCLIGDLGAWAPDI